MPARRTHQTPCNGRRSTTMTWEGGALGGVEEGRSQRSPTMLEPVLGGVHSPSAVAPPRMMAGTVHCGRSGRGWLPIKASLQCDSLQSTSSSQLRAEPLHLLSIELRIPRWRLWWPSNGRRRIWSKCESGHRGLAT